MNAVQTTTEKNTTSEKRMAYTVKQSREQLGGISHAFFYNLIKTGQIKIFKVGNRTLISHKELQRFIADSQA